MDIKTTKPTLKRELCTGPTTDTKILKANYLALAW